MEIVLNFSSFFDHIQGVTEPLTASANLLCLHIYLKYVSPNSYLFFVDCCAWSVVSVQFCSGLSLLCLIVYSDWSCLSLLYPFSNQLTFSFSAKPSVVNLFLSDKHFFTHRQPSFCGELF